jgi:hypothetical protein
MMVTERLAPTPSARARWLFAVGALLFFGLNIVLLAPAGGEGSSTHLIGHVVGSALGLALVVLLVYGVVRVARRGQGLTAPVTVAFWTLSVLAAVNLAAAWGRAHRHSSALPVTAAERRGLQIGRDSIRHHGFAFSLPSPGTGFATAPELQARLDDRLRAHRNMVAWILRRGAPAATLTVQVAKVSPVDEGVFRDFSVQLKAGMTRAGAAMVVQDSLSWRPEGGEYKLAVRAPGPVRADVRCVSPARAESAVIVCVQTTGDDASELASVRAGLSVHP